MQSQKKSKGIRRNKTQIFFLCKEARRKKSSRFAKQNLSFPQQPRLKEPLVELERMPTMPTLPPQWVDKYELCSSTLQQIGQIKKKILTEQSRRLSCLKVSDEKDSQQKIYQYSSLITSKLRKCERLLKQIKNEAQPESEADQKTCKNICMKLALDIQQTTRQIRAQQRAFIQQRKQIQNSTKVSFLQLAAQKVLDEDEGYFNDNGEEVMEEKYTVERNEQIMKIVESVQELNEIFKELSNLVIIQGSLLDRIDYNIDESLVQVRKGKNTLQRVDNKQKTSKCACRTMVLMILGIIILLVVLLVKWFA